MPELAEVEYYRKQWDPGLGQTVRQVHLNRTKRIFRDIDLDAMATSLTGARLKGSATHGKQMCFFFNEQIHLGVHLGMTGKLRTDSLDRFSRFKHDHLVLEMSNGQALVLSDSRMFGRVLFSANASASAWWSELPPEVLSDEFTFERMDAFLTRRSGAVIKSVLLMQEMFPGVGNWMADEILWRSQTNPNARAGDLGSELRAELYRHVRAVSDDAMRVIGSDWGTPPDSWLFNHRWKDGGRCPQTQTALTRESIGGRTTCWSPQWQVYP